MRAGKQEFLQLNQLFFGRQAGRPLKEGADLLDVGVKRTGHRFGLVGVVQTCIPELLNHLWIVVYGALVAVVVPWKSDERTYVDM